MWPPAFLPREACETTSASFLTLALTQQWIELGWWVKSTCGSCSGQCGWPSASPTVRPHPGANWSSQGDADKSVCHLQVSNLACRDARSHCDNGHYPDNRRGWTSCTALPFFAPPTRSRVKQLFTSGSGYTWWLSLGESCETKEMTWNSILWPLSGKKKKRVCAEAALTWLCPACKRCEKLTYTTLTPQTSLLRRAGSTIWHCC